MSDPLADLVIRLQPTAPLTKLVTGRGAWRVRRSEAGRLAYFVILEGSCCLAVDGHEERRLEPGDFVLVPAADDYTATSLEPPPDGVLTEPVLTAVNEVRLGLRGGRATNRMLVGNCVLGSADAALLVSLLPRMVHLRGQRRIDTIVEMLREESRERRPARDVILARLMEVLLIEAFRSTAATGASPGLLRGLADERLATALRQMHEYPGRAWTVVRLAREAGLSRSTFFERFTRVVGVAPIEYLLRWRIALAKDLLQRSDLSVADVAERVGYGSASAFSVAFTRQAGMPPTHYAQQHAERPRRTASRRAATERRPA